MAKYRRKPEMIDAVRYTGVDSFEEISKFVGEAIWQCVSFYPHSELLEIPGLQLLKIGDFITKDVYGRILVYDQDDFLTYYERVDPLNEAYRTLKEFKKQTLGDSE